MLVKLIEEFNFKLNAVSLVGSNTEESDAFFGERVHTSQNCNIPTLSCDPLTCEITYHKPDLFYGFFQSLMII